MKHFKIVFLFFLLNYSFPTFGFCSSVIFTVDITDLLKLTVPGKKLILENNKSRKLLQTENEALENKLLTEEKELSELRNTLSTDEFRAKAIQFDKRVTGIRKKQAKKEEDLNNQIRKEEANFLKAIYPLLYEILSERGGVILLDQRNVILWDSSVDITSEAIDVINRVLGAGIKLDEK